MALIMTRYSLHSLPYRFQLNQATVANITLIAKDRHTEQNVDAILPRVTEEFVPATAIHGQRRARVLNLSTLTSDTCGNCADPMTLSGCLGCHSHPAPPLELSDPL